MLPEEVAEGQRLTAPDQSEVDQSQSLRHGHQAAAPPLPSGLVGGAVPGARPIAGVL